MAAVSAIALLLGCGSGAGEGSRDGSAPAQAKASKLLAAGPSDPGENLERLLADSTPKLADVSVECPTSRRPGSYPFSCRLAGTVRGHAVRGEVTVIGVYRPTRTYAYEVGYEPVESGEG